jgi:hypothetical protein
MQQVRASPASAISSKNGTRKDKKAYEVGAQKGENMSRAAESLGSRLAKAE